MVRGSAHGRGVDHRRHRLSREEVSRACRPLRLRRLGNSPGVEHRRHGRRAGAARRSRAPHDPRDRICRRPRRRTLHPRLRRRLDPRTHAERCSRRDGHVSRKTLGDRPFHRHGEARADAGRDTLRDRGRGLGRSCHVAADHRAPRHRCGEAPSDQSPRRRFDVFGQARLSARHRARQNVCHGDDGGRPGERAETRDATAAFRRPPLAWLFLCLERGGHRRRPRARRWSQPAAFDHRLRGPRRRAAPDLAVPLAERVPAVPHRVGGDDARLQRRPAQSRCDRPE